MCGINGILRLTPQAAPVDRRELLRIRDHMAKRGPDSAGEWLSEDGTVGLGHRRLAIIDLSPSGHQPMRWANGRYWIVFNGEIYNYQELRTELQTNGVDFSSRSDTEVLLALFAQYGPAMLAKLRGMYALAVWDAQEQTLFLARDPYGIKPLYYTTDEQYLKFASQVKALQCRQNPSSQISPAGLVGFLLWGAVPEPFTIYESIQSVPAGHYLVVTRGKISTPTPFYEFDHFPKPDASDSAVASAFADSVKAHLVSDVPVALFLSAGLDSTLLATLVHRHQSTPITTFTLRFDEFIGTMADEAPLAKKVAQTLGTNHVEQTVTRDMFVALWSEALDAMDQPSIDGFNTFVISRIAHDAGLKVVLSGLGGDELLGGYPAFRQVPKWSHTATYIRRLPGVEWFWRPASRLLLPSRPKMMGLLQYADDWAGAYFLRRALFLPGDLPPIIGTDLAAEGLAQYDPFEALRGMINHYQKDAWLAVHLMESQQYMRNQLLRDSDWASMASSLELRVPLVDIRLREQLAAGNFEPARSRGKAAAVREAASELPAEVWERPKTGFSFPVMSLLEGDSGNNISKHRWGLQSRQLAKRVLQAFDIDVFSRDGRSAN